MKGPVPAADLGGYQAPLIAEAAVDKVERHIADAVPAGAHVRSGGERNELGGTFFQPTVLTRARGLASRDG